MSRLPVYSVYNYTFLFPLFIVLFYSFPYSRLIGQYWPWKIFFKIIIMECCHRFAEEMYGPQIIIWLYQHCFFLSTQWYWHFIWYYVYMCVCSLSLSLSLSCITLYYEYLSNIYVQSLVLERKNNLHDIAIVQSQHAQSQLHHRYFIFMQTIIIILVNNYSSYFLF